MNKLKKYVKIICLTALTVFIFVSCNNNGNTEIISEILPTDSNSVTTTQNEKKLIEENINKFNLPDNIDYVDYLGSFSFFAYDPYVSVSITDAKVKVKVEKLSELPTSKIFQLEVVEIDQDLEQKEWDLIKDYLVIGYLYVHEDKIYKCFPSEENKNLLLKDELPMDSYLVYSGENEEVEKDNQYHKLSVDEFINTSESIFYDKSKREGYGKGYYEVYNFDINNGLTYYISGANYSNNQIKLVLDEEVYKTKKETIFYNDNFKDEAVKKFIQQYFNKPAFFIDDKDLKNIENLKKLELDGYNPTKETLKNIPRLFSNLRYLAFDFNNMLTKEDFNNIKKIKSLKALDIFAKDLEDISIIDDYDYINIHLTYIEDDNISDILSNELEYANQFEGKIINYTKYLEGNMMYELYVSNKIDEANEFYNNLDSKLFISKVEKGNKELLQIIDDVFRINNATGGLFLEDVNFDGKKDILIKTGHHGNQWYVTYNCYLFDGEKYVKNSNFEKIINASIDYTNKRILSAWRNYSASHGWGIYAFANGDFIMTDSLTREFTVDDKMLFIMENNLHSNLSKYIYTTEKLTDEEVKRSYYIDEDSIDSIKIVDKNELDELVYNENSYFNLYGEQWNTINNLGSYYGFSIYGSSGVNKTIHDIISNKKLYYDVLVSNKPFKFGVKKYSSFQVKNEAMTIEKYLKEFDDEYQFEIDQFALCDLDGNGAQELIFRIGNIGHTVILREFNEEVYAYEFPLRGMQHITIDGKYLSSGGAYDNYVSRIHFEDEELHSSVLANTSSDREGVYYFIDGVEVNNEESKKYFDYFHNSPSIKWYKYNVENMERLKNYQLP